MKAKFTNIKDKLVDALNELTDQHWLAIFGFFMLALGIGSMIIAPLSASAVGEDATMILKAGTYKFNDVLEINTTIAPNYIPTEMLYEGTYSFPFIIDVGGETGQFTGFKIWCDIDHDNELTSLIATMDGGSIGIYTQKDGWGNIIDVDMQTITVPTDTEVDVTFGTWYISNTNYNEVNGGSPTDCPTLEEQIANYNGTWVEFLMMLRQNNRTLANSYQNNIDLAIQSGFQNGNAVGFEQGFDEGHLEGYTEGFNAGLNGGANRDPIDQYWNSTKDYILIAGQPYFAPNGFGSIDQYNTVGIYGEHDSKLHRADGTTQTFNGQFVTQFASAGTLGGGWYKIGATVGDANAYEESLTPQANDKAYYVSRVSPLGDPVEEFLVAIWVDGYEAWYVAEEFTHLGTVANNNISYKQVYSIYMTDISPTAQRFVNYDNPTLHETFNEDINATLFLATFNQLNNYNVYTDDIGIVESYNNGFDAGANTTLWTDLISQPIVAFFSIPLAQVIVEGVTYTLTYGIVLGAGIVALIVIWFLKLFAGG